MAKQTIGLGTPPAGTDGDTVRTGFDKANKNFDELYTRAQGRLAKNIAGGAGTVALTPAEALNGIIDLIGALSGDRIVTVPADLQQSWVIRNNTTGSGSVTIKTPAGTGAIVPRGASSLIYSDGANVVDVNAPLWKVGRTLLATRQVAGQSAVTFTSVMSAAYDVYELEFIDLAATADNSALHMQVSGDNGAIWQTSGYDSILSSAGNTNTAVNLVNLTARSAIVFTEGIGNGTANGRRWLSGTAKLHGFSRAAHCKSVTWDLTARLQNDGLYRLSGSGAWMGSSAPLNALLIAMSGSSFASGTINLYGSSAA
ncbi:hypothetical protein B551_0222775 [Cupriavidus sp. HPC(L)]|uniref:hypothetical protein n=1 Tax=Cupriavidus sp. HPC(L) TaxID=1217418 RepID=UPI0002918C30|nr:hypothetical protein [Cupriavidus sp. HPC(L)]ESH90796.1 hypothetical protein B551_0222775 [Cupriavidus sp. HPC(L)]